MRLLQSLALACVAPVLGAGSEPMPRITTDSREYCIELAERLAKMPGPREEAVTRLVEDGVRLCDSGHPRLGVARLRRAMRAMLAGH
ncbi:hypothetical protein GXW77_04325 [Roseomonas alkaliterrae]|jgi:hypothetical protein|uniref:Uncharacterized protein n=1 Tax=Neoroseomonas alkaliterrae TaxID=1452450 RepID=A0A840Y2U3_9PROT|nr:hypothetical protein [Neoroseomonas alkaliterrae]MBB5690687.1 hypothetical protein [Neoroseomonas alkaliterrae]MBR0675397.1 hypothetical protein [Neoroseomonas alkaliterrae]